MLITEAIGELLKHNHHKSRTLERINRQWKAMCKADIQAKTGQSAPPKLADDNEHDDETPAERAARIANETEKSETSQV